MAGGKPGETAEYNATVIDFGSGSDLESPISKTLPSNAREGQSTLFWRRKTMRGRLRNLYAGVLDSIASKLARRRTVLRTSHCIIGENSSFGDEASVDNHQASKSRVTIGANCFVRGRLMTYGHGGRIKIGDWCYLGERSEIWSMEEVSIGDRVLIAHDVNIHDGTAHSLSAAERHEHFRAILLKGHPKDRSQLPGVRSAPVVIEDDVWISFGVTILKGVRIGAGSVISAKALVTKDVPPGTLYRSRLQSELLPLGESQPNYELD